MYVTSSSMFQNSGSNQFGNVDLLIVKGHSTLISVICRRHLYFQIKETKSNFKHSVHYCYHASMLEK